MFSPLKTAILSAMIGLGDIAAMPAVAQADSLYLNFGGGHREPGVGIYLGGGDRAHYRDRRPRRVCTPNRALNKADRLGINRARVVDVDRRTIEVRGRKHGRRVEVTFGRGPNCPIVRW